MYKITTYADAFIMLVGGFWSKYLAMSGTAYVSVQSILNLFAVHHKDRNKPLN